MKKIAGNPYLMKIDNKLMIGSIHLEKLIQDYKTPFLIFLEERIRDNIKSFFKFFNGEFDNFQCFYSLKANFLPEICNIVCSEGIGAKAVSLPELKLALKLGFPPHKIIVGGPYLPEELIESCIKHKINEIIIYSLSDLKKINNIAQKFDFVQNISIRVISEKYQSKLGIKFDHSQIKNLKAALSQYKNIKITSILSHFGTQMNNIEQFEQNIKSLVTNFKQLIDNNIFIESINLGGGFPEATVMKQEQLKKIAKLIKEYFNRSNLNLPNIIFN